MGIFLSSGVYCSRAESNPAHPRVTQAVGWCYCMEYAVSIGHYSDKLFTCYYDANCSFSSLFVPQALKRYTLSMLPDRVDVFTLAKLMGHEGITVLQRCLKQTNLGTEQAHHRADLVDNC
jgi:hypothetical protein